MQGWPRLSGQWRASVRDENGWRVVRPAEGPYATASLVEWGSITKGLVGTAAALTLPLDEQVRQLAPRFHLLNCTIGDLVQHTSGLPRLPIGMVILPSRSPYRRTIGKPLEAAKVAPIRERGVYRYSNLGYSVLGELLDTVDGDWFETVRTRVLEPAGVRSATIRPPDQARVMPRRLGRSIAPWALSNSPYAAAGGVWSTFEDLCRYADWVCEGTEESSRSIAWQNQSGAMWINGQVRASTAVIVSASGATAVVHGLAQRLPAVDRVATEIVKQSVKDGAAAR